MRTGPAVNKQDLVASARPEVDPNTARPLRWYVLYLRSRYERKVSEELHRHGFESFLPCERQLRQWSDRKKEIEVPLFPGYVFVRLALRDRVVVLQVNGVVRFVSVDNCPTAVPDHQIHSLKLAVTSLASLRKEPRITEGRLVMVTGGPLAGVRGVVLRETGSTRVVIAVDGINRAISVEVPSQSLKMIAAGDTA